MQYEINFLILQSKTEKLDKIRKKGKSLLEKRGAKITDELFYQKRKLAYEINHEQYGFYSVFRFDLENDGEEDSVKKIRKDLDFDADIARYIVVRADELLPLQKEIKGPTVEERGTIKQEEVSQVLTKKKTAAEPKKDEIKKEDLEKELKKTKEAPKRKEEKKDESTLDDLDKKLDEILSS